MLRERLLLAVNDLPPAFSIPKHHQPNQQAINVKRNRSSKSANPVFTELSSARTHTVK